MSAISKRKCAGRCPHLSGLPWENLLLYNSGQGWIMAYWTEKHKILYASVKFWKAPLPLCFMFCSLRSSCNQISCHTLESVRVQVLYSKPCNNQKIPQPKQTRKKHPNSWLLAQCTEDIFLEDCFPTKRIGRYIKNSNNILCSKLNWTLIFAFNPCTMSSHSNFSCIVAFPRGFLSPKCEACF